MVSDDEQLSLWADWMSHQTILCPSLTSNCQHIVVAGNSLGFQRQLLRGFRRLPNLTTANSKCPVLNHKCDVPSLTAPHSI